MAAGIRLPGVPRSSSFPRSPLVRLIPSPRRCCGVSSRSVSHGGHPPPHISFSSSFRPHLPPYCPFLLSMQTPGSFPEASFSSPTQCHPFAYFHIAPFQGSSTSILKCGLCVLPHTLYPEPCCSFRPCATSYYHGSCPTLEPR